MVNASFMVVESIFHCSFRGDLKVFEVFFYKLVSAQFYRILFIANSNYNCIA